jgi:hypothetical protein
MTALDLPPIPFARSIHISPRLNVAYVNNPKVACSSIKLTLQQAELDDRSYRPATSVHDLVTSPLLTMRKLDGGGPVERAAAMRAALEGCYVFSFVREPFGRLRSAYLNKIVRRQKKGNFRVDAGFDADTCPPFGDFVQSVCAQDPVEQNTHWRLQALNLSLDVISYDRIGRLERFAQDWAQIAAATGLPARTARAGRSTDTADKAQLHFTPALKRAVQTAYAADFERFGYDPDASD